MGLSVKEIVDKYQGNKKDIAQAAQFALIDPTAAVLAGMYIDRIREAEALEKEQAATVAEQVFSPKPEPEAVSQMQLAQQGLGGAPAPAPAPAPKMPMAPRPPRGMTFPKPSQGIAPNLPNVNMGMGMGATPQATQMQAMQKQMAPRPSVAGVDKLPMGSGMIPRASGGLLAFAGGGDIPGYANGELVQNNISSLARRQIEDRERNRQTLTAPTFDLTAPTFEDPNFDIGAATQNYRGALDAFLPDGSPRAELMEYYTPEKVTERGEALKTRAGERADQDFWQAVTMGGLTAAANAEPSTGSVVGDLVGTLSQAGVAAMPGIMESRKATREAEDKALAMQEESIVKRLELAVADRQDKIATLTPAFNAAVGAEKAALEKELAKYNADLTVFRAQLDDANAYRRDRAKSKEQDARQTRGEKAQMARTREQIASSEKIASSQPPAVEIQRRDAIYNDELNIREERKGSPLTQREKDEVLRFASEQAAIGTAFALQDMKVQQENFNSARKEFAEATTDEALRLAIINDPKLSSLATAVQKNPNDEKARKTYDDAVQAWKESKAAEASKRYGVPMSSLGYGVSTGSGAVDLGAEAESFGGTLR
jgi:hypothetical protein